MCASTRLAELHSIVGERHDPLVVRGDDDHAARVGDLAQQPQDPLDLDVVEVGGRLVREQQRRVERKRAGDRDALLLAAGKLCRAGARAALAEADLRRAARRARRAPRARPDRRRAAAPGRSPTAVRLGIRLNAWKTMPTLRRR